MARIMALKPIVSLNRQEAQIAAERAGMDVDTLGVQWQHRYGAAPLFVTTKMAQPV